VTGENPRFGRELGKKQEYFPGSGRELSGIGPKRTLAPMSNGGGGGKRIANVSTCYIGIFSV